MNIGIIEIFEPTKPKLNNPKTNEKDFIFLVGKYFSGSHNISNENVPHINNNELLALVVKSTILWSPVDIRIKHHNVSSLFLI